MNSLFRTAGVFNFTIPAWLEDDAVVGKIVGVSIHAGEVRRLNEALKNTEEPIPADATILNYLESQRLIEAIKYRRMVSNDNLKDAKEYVEQIGVRHGIRRVVEQGTFGPIYSWA